MEFKGTKGKWQTKHGDVFSDTQGYNDAICDVYHFDTDEGKANANLISKSRDMLEMLEYISKNTEQICNDSGMGYIIDYDDMNKLTNLIKEATEI